MKKYRLIRGALLGVALVTSSPTIAKAEAKGFAITSSSLETNAANFFDRLIDWSASVDEKVSEKVVDPLKDKLNEMSLFSKDSLWLIEKQGSLAKEESHYFFVHKEHSIAKNYYYDRFYNEVKKDSPEVAGVLTKEMYFSVNDLDDEAFLKMIYENKMTGEVYVNFADVNENGELSWLPDAKLGQFNKQFIRYQNWMPLLGVSNDENKISIDELNVYLEQLEDQRKENELIRSKR